MPNETFPWLGFPPAVDLANTVIITPAGELDLLETDDQLDEWIASERARIPEASAASGRLADVQDLRDAVRQLLHAHALGRRLPDAARRRINAISSAAPIRLTLTPDGRARRETDAPDAYALFEATIARSAIKLADRRSETLSVCEAPSCGMLFMRGHPRQVWCSKPCGNRARVARHAHRQRSRRRRATA